MDRRPILIIAFIFVWVVASWQWYTCSVKGVCAVGGKTTSCAPYLNSFIRQGDTNDVQEVKKLERFLNTHENAGLVEDGIYGSWDTRAVEAFQWKYRDEILTPWGYDRPTGYVFTTTRDAINRILCTEKNLITNPYHTNATSMFTEPVTRAYDLSDATLEILLMLLGSFILGWLFRHIFGGDVLSKAKSYLPTLAIQRAPMVIHSPYRNDDLKIVEGIGPKIEALFKAHGIQNWEDLANATPAQLREILNRGGDRFALAEPKTWPDQAALAREGRFDELKKFQNVLMAGRSN